MICFRIKNASRARDWWITRHWKVDHRQLRRDWSENLYPPAASPPIARPPQKNLGRIVSRCRGTFPPWPASPHWLRVSGPCWDTFKIPENPAFQTRSIMDWFTDLDRGSARLGVAGKLT